MSVLFLEYPKCTTCKKAKAWLESNAVAFEDRHIVEANPTAEELKAWWEKSGLTPARCSGCIQSMIFKNRFISDTELSH